jgi:hypothetical protein
VTEVVPFAELRKHSTTARRDRVGIREVTQMIPQLKGVRRKQRNGDENQDGVAEHAVRCEPFSTRFPANREKYRELREFIDCRPREMPI